MVVVFAVIWAYQPVSVSVQLADARKTLKATQPDANAFRLMGLNYRDDNWLFNVH